MRNILVVMEQQIIKELKKIKCHMCIQKLFQLLIYFFCVYGVVEAQPYYTDKKFIDILKHISKPYDDSYNYKIEMFYLDKFYFVEKCDTFYTLEEFNYTNGTYYFKIWNKIDSTEFSYNKNIGYKFEKIFINRICNYIENWDLKSLKMESKLNSNISPNFLIYSNMIIFRKGKYKIKSFKFFEFINPEIDFLN